MNKIIMLIAFLYLAFCTGEMMARNMLRPNRETHERPKRGDCKMYGPCSASKPCDSVNCGGTTIDCYAGRCIPKDADPYKRKRSINFPESI